MARANTELSVLCFTVSELFAKTFAKFIIIAQTAWQDDELSLSTVSDALRYNAFNFYSGKNTRPSWDVYQVRVADWSKW
jgi:hypothetical protein